MCTNDDQLPGQQLAKIWEHAKGSPGPARLLIRPVGAFWIRNLQGERSRITRFPERKRGPAAARDLNVLKLSLTCKRSAARMPFFHFRRRAGAFVIGDPSPSTSHASLGRQLCTIPQAEQFVALNTSLSSLNSAGSHLIPVKTGRAVWGHLIATCAIGYIRIKNPSFN